MKTTAANCSSSSSQRPEESLDPQRQSPQIANSEFNMPLLRTPENKASEKRSRSLSPDESLAPSRQHFQTNNSEYHVPLLRTPEVQTPSNCEFIITNHEFFMPLLRTKEVKGPISDSVEVRRNPKRQCKTQAMKRIKEILELEAEVDDNTEDETHATGQKKTW